MDITTEQIKSLRDQTGISIMQCKKALEEAGGDREKAVMILKKKGKEVASKKAGRTLGAGVIASYVHTNSNVGAMVELACETDFVARNEDFKKLAHDIAMQVTANDPEFVSIDRVSDEEKAKVTALYEKEVKESGKPKEIQEKMLTGKINSYLSERTLLEQPFVKDGDMTIKDLIEAAIQKFGEKTEVVRFVRFSVAGK